MVSGLDEESKCEPRKLIDRDFPYYHVMNTVDHIFHILGALIFIIGSVCFYPEYIDWCGVWSCPFVGALFFIVGSSLWCMAAMMTFVLAFVFSDAHVVVKVKTGTSLCADLLFVIGSVFFLPHVIRIDGLGEGIVCFIAGSALLAVLSIYNIYRAFISSPHENTSFTQFLSVLHACCNFTGSVLFIAGCIVFIPRYYHEYAVTMFVVGSVWFLIGAFVATIPSWKLVATLRQDRYQRFDEQPAECPK